MLVRAAAPPLMTRDRTLASLCATLGILEALTCISALPRRTCPLMTWAVRRAYGIDPGKPGERAGHFLAAGYYNNWGEVHIVIAAVATFRPT